MRRSQIGFSLVELMIAVFVISICLLGVLKLMNRSQRSLTESEGSLQAQSSGEALMQQIRQTRWNAGSVPGARLLLITPPSVTAPVPRPNPPQALEDWNGYEDTDDSRGAFGPFRRSVRVEFVRLAGRNLRPTSTPQHRKMVTVTVRGKTASTTITSVFYNLP
jgi:prepilin-type N-terminal cleavage/methylation domain-containing protein